MKDRKFYTCEYCYKEFEPKRRRVQRYCSNTCRSKAYHARKTSALVTTKSDKVSVLENSPETSIEKMSLPGVGNAAVGILAVDILKNIITKESNKPATKGDLTQLIENLNRRYHLIKNMAPNAFGQYPYFDLVEGVVVYLRSN
ncbi:hypothetical protein [Winogradskyella thalassocola]|uniref:Uncharacterized protein n=1 Tax=Winogradskyella thalassocola TaxID=262004 RepID=A0A1G8BAB7_9FLAO|nr:hypothetical protein [Winogradskyella thalassocola]SDH29973.1 hypothetical protein SAMN04489796_102208 [Winogradskyella thalassocola]